jgi:hypothetical protein
MLAFFTRPIPRLTSTNPKHNADAVFLTWPQLRCMNCESSNRIIPYLFTVLWNKMPCFLSSAYKTFSKSVPMYQNTRRHIPKERTFIRFSRGNLINFSTDGDWIICCITDVSARMNEVNCTDTSTESFEVHLTSFIYAGMNWPWTGWQRLLHRPILALMYFKLSLTVGLS